MQTLVYPKGVPERVLKGHMERYMPVPQITNMLNHMVATGKIIRNTSVAFEEPLYKAGDPI
jgi:hypothetical protein